MNDLIMLASLLEGPKHGYQLKKEARLIFGDGELHNNTVYPLLHQFETKGWVRKKTVAGRRGQVRFQYALTARGREELVHRLSKFPEEGGPAPEAFYLRIGLFPILASQVRQRIMAAREKELQAEVEHTHRLEKGLNLPRFAAEVVRFLRRRAGLELAWIKHLRRNSL